MEGLPLPQLDAPALRESPDGALWRAVVYAAEADAWGGGFTARTGDAALTGGTPAEQTAALCRGLALHLDQMAVSERVRVAARIARILDTVHANTELRPFTRLALIPENDRDSIWQAVLRILVSRDRQGSGPGSWPDYIAYLPAASRAHWRAQLEELDLSDGLRAQIERVLSTDAPPVPGGPSASAGASSSSDDDAAWPAKLAASAPSGPNLAARATGESAPVTAGRTEVLVAGRDLPLPAGAASPSKSAASDSAPASTAGRTISMRSLSALTGAPTPSAPAQQQRSSSPRASGSRMSPEPVVSGVNRTERMSDTPPKRNDELPPNEALGARALQIAVESSEVPATGPATALELVGGYAGRPMPAVLRVLFVVSGLIIVTSVVRLALRFLLGLRREGRVRLEASLVVVESAHYMLGKQMRHTRRTFGPEGLLSVAREVRYPSIYLFIGLFALAFGSLTGTIAFLDGKLAGFENWIRTGLILIIAGIVIDFVFTVIAATRPGRTTLAITFAPKTTVRILGVEQDRAERFLDVLARRANGQ